MKRTIINFIITISVVGLMIATIFYIRKKPFFEVNWFSSNYLNTVLVYQTTTLVLSFVIILITGLQTKFESFKLLSITKMDGPVKPEPWIGLTKNNKDS